MSADLGRRNIPVAPPTEMIYLPIAVTLDPVPLPVGGSMKSNALAVAAGLQLLGGLAATNTASAQAATHPKPARQVITT